ncbi:hypothetical protein A0H81_13607 [Grifola frondosa]|uniref:Distal membrane-arm assembly complex protein 1-like domain-containing protein n=1 Tax=Grifola frondosa TaxID=5627 RepID=A0A1C7LUF7_GRIFR|nr:hypothetical protein A0H81_13607 [Grifola frondosa]
MTLGRPRGLNSTSMSSLEAQSPAQQGAHAQTQTKSLPKDCLACRVIGTAALGGVGVYALNQSRAHAPGSLIGKRIMAGGCRFLGGQRIAMVTYYTLRHTAFDYILAACLLCVAHVFTPLISQLESDLPCSGVRVLDKITLGVS